MQNLKQISGWGERVTWRFTECHFTQCQFNECHFAERPVAKFQCSYSVVSLNVNSSNGSKSLSFLATHSANLNFAERHSAQCHFTKRQIAECQFTHWTAWPDVGRSALRSSRSASAFHAASADIPMSISTWRTHDVFLGRPPIADCHQTGVQIEHL